MNSWEDKTFVAEVERGLLQRYPGGVPEPARRQAAALDRLRAAQRQAWKAKAAALGRDPGRPPRTTRSQKETR